MPEYVIRRGALDPERVESLRKELMASPYVGQSTLAGSFQGSRGFAITFTAEGRARLEQRFPFLSPYLALALDSEPLRRLTPLVLRPFGRFRERLPNAFYLNLLLLGDGAGVGRHTDATLRGPSGLPDALPELVSVLYLAVPPRTRGGELRLFRSDHLRGAITPRPGMLVHFRGDLQHEVVALEGAASGELRASLVCEQYCLPAQALALLAPVHVQSKAGFAAYLTERREPPSFELEK